jgi:transaldolase
MSLSSLIATGTKVWLDGVEPDAIKRNRALGITGATSNPAIVSDIIRNGHFDRRLIELVEQGLDSEAIAWALDDEIVRSAQKVFLPVRTSATKRMDAAAMASTKQDTCGVRSGSNLAFPRSERSVLR